MVLARDAKEIYSPLEPCDKMESGRKRGHVGFENGEIVDLNDKTVTYVKDLINFHSVTYVI